MMVLKYKRKMGPSVYLDLPKWAIDMKNDGESVPVHTVDINKTSLEIDEMAINKIPFVITNSHSINFGTA